MKLGCLFSGGKDSNFALFKASKEHNIKCLITLKSENSESYMFQSLGNNIVKLQSEALNIPLIEYPTLGIKEQELEDLKNAIIKAIKEYNIEGIVTGAIKSTYQASRIQKICNELSIHCFNPLWQINEELFIKELIKEKFEIIILGIFAYPLNKSFVGEIINNNFLTKIKKLNQKSQISIAGEGGEYESFVLNSPMFKKQIQISKLNIIEESGNSCYLELNKTDIKLVEK